MYFFHPSHNFADITLEGAKRGITLELCAGLVDKQGKSLATIATEEGSYNFLIQLRSHETAAGPVYEAK